MRIVLVILVCIFTTTAVSGDPLHETSTQELHLMLNNIEGELSSRGVSMEEKRARIRNAESRMKKLVSRGSVRNAIVGSVLAAAVTAHPAGILVGGVAGGLVGKSKRYSKAEEKLAIIEQDIIVDEDDFLTEGEVRLASFSGDSDDIPLDRVDEHIAKKYGLVGDGDEVQILAEGDGVNGDVEEAKVAAFAPEGSKPEFANSPQMSSSQVNGYQQVTVADAQGISRAQMQDAAAQNTRENNAFELESCYGRSAGDRKSRQNLPHCFYMMY